MRDQGGQVRRNLRGRLPSAALVALALLLPVRWAAAEDFPPPPRSIADITAILDQEKPDPAKVARATRDAAAPMPDDRIQGLRLVQFYRGRGEAAMELGRDKQALADLTKAYEIAKPRLDTDIDRPTFSALINDLARAETNAGRIRTANEFRREQIAYLTGTGGQQNFGRLFGVYQSLASRGARAGNFDEANQWLQKLDALLVDSGHWRKAVAFRSYYAAVVDRAHGEVLSFAGKFADAEPYLRRAAAEAATAETDTADRDWPPRGVYASYGDYTLVELANVLIHQGRLLEAEIEARRALLGELHHYGRYAAETVPTIIALARVLNEEGRYAEAERLERVALDTYAALQIDPGSTRLAEARAVLLTTLVAEERWPAALEQFELIRQGLAQDQDYLRSLERGNIDFVVAALAGGRPKEAVELARQIMEDRARIEGEKHYATALATGLYAASLVATGAAPAAREAYARAAPILLTQARSTESEASQLKNLRLQIVLEGYLAVLAGEGGTTAAADAFRAADALRGRSVQRAIAAAAARTAAQDGALADLVRREQDAQRQAIAQTALLANAYALPSDQRDEAGLIRLRADIDKLNDARAAMHQEIERRFPDYARLADPQPATVAEVQTALSADEALLAVYVAVDHTYIWAVPKAGPVAFATTKLTRAEVDGAVRDLRRALEPNASTLGQIPAFDLRLAYQLYAKILEPVRAGWEGARNLLVVPHGALAQLPFTLLPTAPATAVAERNGDPMFAGYKAVPWLIRKLAVTQLPSVTSLTTLRKAHATAAAQRPFVGFGDPWFSVEQQQEAQRGEAIQLAAASATLGTRGMPVRLRSLPRTEQVNSAQLGLLPRLPETAAEVREVAAVLQADLSKDVVLGAEANEHTVEAMRLDDRRVVMFATHGLVPGDLDGLEEPALALSAPAVAKVAGDGLLTVSKILGLRLNADWVVLSACNTAAGNGAGAEAVSGLGLAFFYAGSRALLVSNWPVETNSARLLTTELFKRSAANAVMTRAEALRQAMLALIDGPGRTDPATGRSLFSYAHPIFWAPFSLVGDGGGRPAS